MKAAFRFLMVVVSALLIPACCPPPNTSDKASTSTFEDLRSDFEKAGNDVGKMKGYIKDRKYVDIADAGLRLYTILEAIYCAISHDKTIPKDAGKELAEIGKIEWSKTLPGKGPEDAKPFLSTDEKIIIQNSEYKVQLQQALTEFGIK